MAKLAGFGAILKRVAVTMGQVMDISGPGLATDMLDGSSHDSVSAFKEKVAGMIELGDVTFQLAWDPALASHITLRGDAVSRTAQVWHLVWPEATTPEDWAFSGFVSGFTPGAPVLGLLTAAITITPTGPLTVT